MYKMKEYIYLGGILFSEVMTKNWYSRWGQPLLGLTSAHLGRGQPLKASIQLFSIIFKEPMFLSKHCSTFQPPETSK